MYGVRPNHESGSAILEFAIVMIALVPLFAGAFTVGESLTKAIQVSNLTRSAGVLMVKSVMDPKAGLNLAVQQNQRILVREGVSLGFALNTNYDPDPNGKTGVFLSKVILVSDNECSAGIVPAPSGAPPWNSGNCPNYGTYAFAYYVAIGNKTRFASVLGAPNPSSMVLSDGTISAHDIAANTGNHASNRIGPGGMITLNPSQFALISETFSDVSGIAIFSLYTPPVMYFRTIS
jgi:hypothetical protein